MSQQAPRDRSTEEPETETETTGGPDEGLDDRTTLAAQVELLQEENQQLRQAFSHARRTEYQRAALGLAVVGTIAVIGAIVFPTVRTVLLALGATGLFAAVLSYYLTPERFVSAAVGEYVYAASVTDHETLASELGLQDTHVYVPTTLAGEGSARLFVPEKREYSLPPENELDSLFVITDDAQQRGVAFEPIGAALFRESRRAVSGDIAADPSQLCDQLGDSISDVFELADGITTDVDPDDGRASIGITGSAYGDVDRFDHPIASLFATGLAVMLETPITIDVTDEADQAEFLVTCRWEPNAEAE
ncbi:hypothetical protein [Halalkalicoccus salilacus]|uniref:hypothetical protein n=1 Tax=Halalkalicoccus salilacus TaxID=3117459 RepID=UPI00300F33EE